MTAALQPVPRFPRLTKMVGFRCEQTERFAGPEGTLSSIQSGAIFLAKTFNQLLSLALPPPGAFGAGAEAGAGGGRLKLDAAYVGVQYHGRFRSAQRAPWLQVSFDEACARCCWAK